MYPVCIEGICRCIALIPYSCDHCHFSSVLYSVVNCEFLNVNSFLIDCANCRMVSELTVNCFMSFVNLSIVVVTWSQRNKRILRRIRSSIPKQRPLRYSIHRRRSRIHNSHSRIQHNRNHTRRSPILRISIPLQLLLALSRLLRRAPIHQHQQVRASDKVVGW